MFRRLKTALGRIRRYEPGERFQAFHREQRHRPPGVKAAFLGASFVAFGAGVVLAFIPGPAILFFALSGALLATHSLWVARRLDEAEVWGRRTLSSLRRWWREKRGGRRPPRRGKRRAENRRGHSHG